MADIDQWLAVHMQPRPFIVGASWGWRSSSRRMHPTLLWMPPRKDWGPTMDDLELMTREELEATDWGTQALAEWDSGDDAGLRGHLEGLGLSCGPSLKLVGGG